MILTPLEDVESVETDIQGHLRFLHDSVLERNAKVVLELGVRKGFSTIAFLTALREVDGRLYSCDINPCPHAEEKVDRYGLHPWWDFTQTDDLEYAKTWTLPIDILFIDSSHEEEHTFAELSSFAPFLAPKGIIMIHDVLSDVSDWGRKQRKAIRRFFDMMISEHWAFTTKPGFSGLAVLSRLP